MDEKWFDSLIEKRYVLRQEVEECKKSKQTSTLFNISIREWSSSRVNKQNKCLNLKQNLRFLEIFATSAFRQFKIVHVINRNSSNFPAKHSRDNFNANYSSTSANDQENDLKKTESLLGFARSARFEFGWRKWAFPIMKTQGRGPNEKLMSWIIFLSDSVT